MLDIWGAFKGFGLKDSLRGGQNGICSCREGFIWKSEFGVRSCFNCDKDTYNDVISSTQCTPCGGSKIADPGSPNATFCKENPLEEISRKNREIAEKDNHMVLMSYLFGAGVIVVFLLVGYRVRSLNARALYAELLMNEALEDKLIRQSREIQYLRDWRIRPTDLRFEKKVARGAEGEVWRGTMTGIDGKVAIKKVNGLGSTWEKGRPVWDEAT